MSRPQPPPVFRRLHYGRFLALQDPAHGDHARTVLQKGIELARSLGMIRHVEIAEQCLFDLADPTLRRSEGGSEPQAVSQRRRAASRMATRGRAVAARWTRGSSDEELVRRFGSSLAQRALFAAVSRSFVPSRAYGFRGDIVLELRPPDDELDPAAADWWTIEIREGRAKARHGRSEDPAVVVHMGMATFVRILSGEIHPVRALIEAQTEVDGDVMLAARLPEMFSAIAAPMEDDLATAN